VELLPASATVILAPSISTIEESDIFPESVEVSAKAVCGRKNPNSKAKRKIEKKVISYSFCKQLYLIKKNIYVSICQITMGIIVILFPGHL
jgi:hypothetical protein